MIKVSYDKFTDCARKTMQLANKEAQILGHEYIGSEHVLLGLVKEGSGVAANVLKELGVDLRKIRLEVEKRVPGPEEAVVIGRLPRTSRAIKVLERACVHASELQLRYVGTEHLLLGLVSDPDQESIVSVVLRELDLDTDKVKNKILKFYATGTEQNTSKLPSDH